MTLSTTLKDALRNGYEVSFREGPYPNTILVRMQKGEAKWVQNIDLTLAGMSPIYEEESDLIDVAINMGMWAISDYLDEMKGESHG